MLSSYMGKSDTFDRAIADFSMLYADQNEKDPQPSPVRSSRAR
jgi:hypothetical protein